MSKNSETPISKSWLKKHNFKGTDDAGWRLLDGSMTYYPKFSLLQINAGGYESVEMYPHSEQDILTVIRLLQNPNSK
jgi:hypothetical protein